MKLQGTAVSMAFALMATTALAQDAQTMDAETIALTEFRYDELYQDGMSARDFVENMDAISQTGEDIGQIEDLIVGQNGDIIAITAEIGGFLDIGDTHVSVPFDQVEMTAEGLVLPVTEETIEDFTVFNADYMTAQNTEGDVVQQIDDAEVAPSFYRMSELIGDYARLSETDGPREFGYVRDAIIRDGKVEAVVVSGAMGYGVPGYRAYPYYGADRGYQPAGMYYDMPYTVEDVEGLERFDYERMESLRETM